jgi:hypothetical protein
MKLMGVLRSQWLATAWSCSVENDSTARKEFPQLAALFGVSRASWPKTTRANAPLARGVASGAGGCGQIPDVDRAGLVAAGGLTRSSEGQAAEQGSVCSRELSADYQPMPGA